MRELGREAGIASGFIRQQKIIERFRKIMEKEGFDKTILICRKQAYNAGYTKRLREESKSVALNMAISVEVEDHKSE